MKTMPMKWIKSIKPKEKRTDITVLPIAPGTAILSAAMLLAFLILLIVLNLNGMIDLPHWVERIIGTAEDVNDDGDSFGDAFLSSLSGTEHAVSQDPVFMPADNASLLNILREAAPAESYYQSCTLSRVNADEKTVTRQIFRFVSGKREYTEVLFRGQLERSVTIGENAVRIIQQNETRTFEKSPDSVFTAESEIGFPSYTRMLALLDAAEAGQYTLSLSAAQNTSCIRADFTDTLSGTREVFDILPEYGLIYAASSYLPGQDTPYYTLLTTSLLTDITGFDESVFDIPNS